ncbi:coagulation factor XIII A chain-like [Labrus mixtus]|uniref:coagulation factor XIII A chain-like n=1 Tax=Labrus mixtus TaxID=508554 RepID=UPI0029C007CB|nr:coagulation factor XIII A chain-like [Labrus mixtus]
MTSSAKESNTHRGRYSEPVPTSNLTNDEADFPEFEFFDEKATPRSNAPSGDALSVVKVDMCQSINKPNHYTVAYDITNLVVRRGKQFVIRITFNRPIVRGDDFQVEFLIGSHPSPSKGTLLAVTFGDRKGSSWSGTILEEQGESMIFGITPTANAIVGKFRCYVAVITGNGIQRTKRDARTDLYLLCNAWCPEDAVFLNDEAERKEYILNDNGMIFQGAYNAVSYRNWMYGQFEKGILDACIYILDCCRIPISTRGNVIQVVRMVSSMVNAQDDNGVLVGNWGSDFSMGKSPSSWTGSVQILLQYVNTGVPVAYAQCWVFAGVFNTLLRCLGIPARVITNFNSAHDSTGNLKTDLIFKMDGSPDRRHTMDSIWNYHCWNEVFINRHDLPPHCSGWQVVDATPQETSDGYYRCGPSSVNAIKDGLLCHPFDCGFVFAEVNSDIVCYKRNRYGTLNVFWVHKSYVGMLICTKAVGRYEFLDITHNYKYRQGSPEDNRTMERAEEYGCERDHSELDESEMSVPSLQVQMCQDVILAVDFQNQGDLPKTVQAHLSESVIFYTGVIANHFKDYDFTVTVPAHQMERVMLKVTAEEYLPHLGNQLSLHFVVTGQADEQSLTAIKVVDLQTPELTMEVSGQPQVQQEMFVTVSFTNPYSFPLRDVVVAIEGPGLMSYKTRSYSVIEPQASYSWKESFIPRLEGQRRLVAFMVCSNLGQVTSPTFSVHITLLIFFMCIFWFSCPV